VRNFFFPRVPGRKKFQAEIVIHYRTTLLEIGIMPLFRDNFIR